MFLYLGSFMILASEAADMAMVPNRGILFPAIIFIPASETSDPERSYQDGLDVFPVNKGFQG